MCKPNGEKRRFLCSVPTCLLQRAWQEGPFRRCKRHTQTTTFGIIGTGILHLGHIKKGGVEMSENEEMLKEKIKSMSDEQLKEAYQILCYLFQ